MIGGGCWKKERMFTSREEFIEFCDKTVYLGGRGMKEVFFFLNGNTTIVDGKRQFPELQIAWFELVIKHLIAKGEDPTKMRFNMPDGKIAEPFKTEYGWSWRIE